MWKPIGAAVLALLALVPAAPAGAAPSVPRLSARFAKDMERLAPTERYGAFVHFRGGAPSDRGEFLAARDLMVTSVFDSVDVVFATGFVRDFATLRDEPSVSYLEADEKLALHGETATWASRARVAQEAVSGGPYRDPSGRILDGTGVGVAIVDTGVNGLHPDFDGRMAKNYKIMCSTQDAVSTEQCPGGPVLVETPQSDTSGGHGTHVAGIVAGSGAQSEGTYTGVAPGASLYGYGAGDAISVYFAAAGLRHILDHNHEFDPRIHVVNNSWGSDGPYDPRSVISKLVKELVESGVTVVFTAGNGDTLNHGGDGSDDRTSSYCKDPTPGVICVANYNDAGRGARDAQIDQTSSRGRSGRPNTYPDISAPGSSITSTCLPPQRTCANGVTTRWAPFYAVATGTSMAAPHVAGVVALLLQGRPDLTPAQVENILQDTAHKFTTTQPDPNVPQPTYETDPQNPDGTHSFDKGAGLVDVPAAVRGLGIAGASRVPHPSVQVTTGDGGDYPGPGAADIVSLHATNEETGVRYAATVADVEDIGPGGMTELLLLQNVDGRQMSSSVLLTVAGPQPGGTNFNANPTTVEVDPDTDTVVFFVPFDRLGDPPANSPAHNVILGSFVREASTPNQIVVQDVAPGQLGLMRSQAFPVFGKPYTVRPAPIPDPEPLPLPTTTAEPPASQPSAVGDLMFGPEVATIMIGNPGQQAGLGITETEFLEHGCDISKMEKQAFDGYVFELEEPTAASATDTVTLMGKSTLPYDLDLRFFGADCTELGPSIGTVNPDEIGFVPDGTKWIVSNLFLGAETDATLTVYSGVETADTELVLSSDTYSGTYSHETGVAATVTERDSGTELSGLDVRFRLTPPEDDDRRGDFELTWVVETVDGVAAASLPAGLRPGTYRLEASFEGGGGLGASQDDAAVIVEKEATSITTTASGNGPGRRLEATLLDHDGAPPVEGATIVFSGAGGEYLGSGVTDSSGLASIAAPPSYRGQGATWTASFGGSEDLPYAPSYNRHDTR